MGWNQRHCDDDQIIIPMTIHRSKLELERPRYHENWDEAPINAPLTSKSHNFWSDCWIFKFHTFFETWSQDLSKGVKINLIRGGLRLVALQGPPPWSSCRGYKKPYAPFRPGETTFFWVLLFAWYFYMHFSLFQTHTKKRKEKKNTSKLLDSSLFTKNTRYCSYTQSSFLWFYTWDLGFRGVDEAFLASIHTPNLLNLSLAFSSLLLS